MCTATTDPRKTSEPEPAMAAPASTPTIAETSANTGQKRNNSPQLIVRGPEMRKKEMIDLVVIRSGMKKRDAKPVVEVMLGVLGEALAEGRELIMPPFGRIRGHKEKVLPKKRMIIARIHQNIAPKVARGPSEEDPGA